MKSRLYRSIAIIFPLSLSLVNFNPSVGQVLVPKSGSLIEKRILREQPQEIKVINPRGNLQWQQSNEGVNWRNWDGKTETSVWVAINSILFLRCAIQEANCDIVYSDILRLIPIDSPTVTTNALSNIQKSSAVGGGNIVNDGGDLIQRKGVCWSRNQSPTLADNQTTDGEGMGSYSSILTGLNPATMYYVRAYAINSAGTAYGDQVSFTTEYDVTLPSVITTAISSITQTTAEGGGTVFHNGHATVTARGICWGTSQNPTTVDRTTTDGIGSGMFYSSLTGLTGNTMYYVRAYCTNSAGTNYGNEVRFTTSPFLPTITTTAISAITQTSASSGGEVLSDGGGSISARGVCWSTSPDPTTSDRKTTDGTGAGAYTSILESLTGNTNYYVRAYSTNSVGTSYGNEVSFRTSPVLPTLNTAAVSAITQTTASSGGTITSDGGGSVTARGMCWSTSSNPTLSDRKTTDGEGTGVFTSSLTGLTGNTTYYGRAYATNSAGTNYGTKVSFKTSPVLPSITTIAVSAITQTTGSSGGSITSDGGSAITARGVCWSTSSNPTINDSKTADGTGTGLFTSSLTALTDNTAYYVRAYAINSVGTAYGPEVTFATLSLVVVPTILTTAVSGITQTTATCGGIVMSSGGADITRLGICWSTATNPTTDNSLINHSLVPVFTTNLTGLLPSTTYYARAFAMNSAGTGYGDQVIFRTLDEEVQADSFTDMRDGTTYNWVSIGNQVWMSENLAYLPVVSPSSDGSETSPFYYVYDYEGSSVNEAKATSNYATYGVLYNLEAAKTACPTGWRIPTDDEWKVLEKYLGMSEADLNATGYRYSGSVGGKLKEPGTLHWLRPNAGATNKIGFNALPGGSRYGSGGFGHLGTNADFRSASEDGSQNASLRYLDYSIDGVGRGFYDGRYAFSVRCLMN